MMGTISGRYVRTFAEADTVILDDVSYNAPYPFFWLRLIRIEGLVLVCEAAGAEHRLPTSLKGGYEKATVLMQDPAFGPLSYLASPFLCEGGQPIQPSLAFTETGTPAADTAGVPASSSTGEHA